MKRPCSCITAARHFYRHRHRQLCSRWYSALGRPDRRHRATPRDHFIAFFWGSGGRGSEPTARGAPLQGVYRSELSSTRPSARSSAPCLMSRFQPCADAPDGYFFATSVCVAISESSQPPASRFKPFLDPALSVAVMSVRILRHPPAAPPHKNGFVSLEMSSRQNPSKSPQNILWARPPNKKRSNRHETTVPKQRPFSGPITGPA